MSHKEKILTKLIGAFELYSETERKLKGLLGAAISDEFSSTGDLLLAATLEVTDIWLSMSETSEFYQFANQFEDDDTAIDVSKVVKELMQLSSHDYQFNSEKVVSQVVGCIYNLNVLADDLSDILGHVFFDVIEDALVEIIKAIMQSENIGGDIQTFVRKYYEYGATVRQRGLNARKAGKDIINFVKV